MKNHCNSVLRSARLSALLATSLFATVVQAQAPEFASVFGNNMVLPHGEVFTLSGSAAPAASLSLEVSGRRYHLTSDAAGHWQTSIAPLAAGGPYSIAVSNAEGETASLDNVLAGELWLCSGQSNMAYSVAVSTDQPEAFNQGHAAIRLLSVPLRAELDAQADFIEQAQWQVASDDTVPSFSAICYFFARQRIANNGIPLGLINASWGGSAIEAWVSEQSLNAVPGYDRKVEQLQLFRQDRRAAELSFADDWIKWWHSASEQGPVWEQGMLDTNADWRDAALENWKSFPDERLANHHGILWYSNSFVLTQAQAMKAASFVLGKVDEVDTTWINGSFVNNTFGYGTRREYPLAAGVLKAGINQVTVNVLNSWDVGGLLGPADDVSIRFADGETVPLGSGWKYRYIPRETGYPPRSPWESVAGITGMYNGMIAPLLALKPSGVLWYQGESNAEASGTYHALLSTLISDWRGHFEYELPFIVIQLPNYGAVATEPAESGWATLRHVQQQVALHDARVGLVVTHDAGNDIDIHPRRKFIVGSRAAAVADAMLTGGMANGVVASVVDKSAAGLRLAFMPPLTVLAAQPVAGFSLCNSANGQCRYVDAVQQGSQVLVDLTAFTAADTLRYCWSDGGECQLKAINEVPVSSFELFIE